MPGSLDDALIDASGTYTVESLTARTVHSLTMAIGASLEIGIGDFTLDFFGADTNNGTINVYSHLTVFGALDNTGVIHCFGAPIPNVPPHPLAYFQPTGTSTNSGTIEAINDAEISFNISPVNGPVSFTNYGIIEANGGSIITIGGNFGATSSFTNIGTIEALGQGSIVDLFSTSGTITNSGHLVADGGTIQINNPNSVSGSGTAEIRNGGTLFIGTSFAENTTFDPGANGTLQLAYGAAFTGSLSGFTTGDRIDFSGLPYSGSTLTFDPTKDILTVSNGGYALTIHLSGSYVASGFQVSADASGSAQVTYTPAGQPPMVSGPIVSSKSEDDAAYTLDLLQFASDPDHDVLHVANVTGLAKGVTLDGDTLHVDPNAYDSLAVGEHATINVNYNIVDGNSGSVPQTATITINGENDAPVTLTTLASVPLGSAIEGRAYYDPDITNILQITALSFEKQTVVGEPGESLVIQGKYGTFLLSSEGHYTYWTDPHASIQSQMSDSFSWTVTDGYSTTQSSLRINVTPSAVQFTPVLVGNPIDSTQISQGNLTHETHKGHLSWAYDFLAPKNTDVSAVADGTVVFVQDDLSETAGAYWSGYGNIVTIASYVDGQMFYTTYAHLATGSAGALAAGDVVTEGQVIAKSGDTGTLYKGGLHPHLHIQFGTELYSGTLNNTTAGKGLIADGLNDQIWPAYFEKLDINFNFNGNDGSKEYKGTPGRDVFTANNKGDTIYGYGGDDLLIAGAGADRFVFNKYSTGDTTIENFEAGKDHIVLRDNIRVADLATTSAGTVLDLSIGGTILLDHVTNYADWHLLF
ncbi:hypothetical protein XI03_11255 [Bradyrhizobium sp. CCBAU 65884]|nr:hypothetical protein [Bradyrhizobium sp. CCBAU 65884]